VPQPDDGPAPTARGENAPPEAAHLFKDPGGFDEILSGRGMGLALLGSNLRVRWSNRRHVEVHSWGVPAGEHCYRQLCEAERPCAGCVVKEVLRTGRTSSFDRRIPTGDGETWVHLSASPVYGPSRRLDGVMLITVDLGGEEHVLERDEAEKMASLGLMAAAIVHELNNIIGGMSGHAELAMLHPEREEMTRHALQVVTQNSRRAQEILKQLVHYSQQSTQEVASVSFVEVIEQVLHLASRNLELAEVRVLRKFDSSPTLVANPWRLRMLLLNLMLDALERVRRNSDLTVCLEECSGAIDCTRKTPRCAQSGCVRLVLRYEPRSPTEPTTGPTPRCGFERVTSTTQRYWHTFDAASRTVREMSGNVWVREDGSSRCVEVVIPLEREPAGEGGASAPGLPDRIRRALVVDDEEVICELVKAVLTDDGYQVTTASSGRSAVELLRAESFDVVVLDVMMPGELNGLATLRQIREVRPECRVLLMTGRPPDDELEAQLRQADAHVLKPFHCQQLIERLRDIAV